jgi:murein DD-endopeptidase MepM/ murein hydrolase activator NlpD
MTRRAFLKAASALAAASALGSALPMSSQAASLVDPYIGVVPLTFPMRRGAYWIYNNWHVPRVGSILAFNHQMRAWLRAHDGIDIFALKGTALYACAAGKVVEYPRPRYVYGNYVWIQNGEGYRFFYCHLDKVFVKTGQVVDTGTVVGTVGNTGNAATTPSHLHFEVHYPAGNVYTCKHCSPRKNVSSINPYYSLIAATAHV